MPEATYIFKRTEKKYALTENQRQRIFERINDRVVPDEYGKSTISSIYLDTDDFRIIRGSIDTDNYKEKLRLRSYGRVKDNDTVFLEIKKKCNSVVYKRRVALRYDTALDYIAGETMPPDSQIMREINYAMKLYDSPFPRAVICYEREAYYVADLPAFRLTFDSGIRCRANDLSLSSPTEGRLILPEGISVMEIKTDGVMPLWLSRILDEEKIFPVSFSKYGSAFRQGFFKGVNTSCKPYSKQFSTAI